MGRRASLNLLRHLGREAKGSTVAVVCGLRDVEPHSRDLADLLSSSDVETYRLAPLTSTEVAAYLDAEVIVDRVGWSLARWHLLRARAARALLNGHFGVAEQLATEALAIATQSQDHSARDLSLAFLTDVFALVGRFGEIEPLASPTVDDLSTAIALALRAGSPPSRPAGSRSHHDGPAPPTTRDSAQGHPAPGDDHWWSWPARSTISRRLGPATIYCFLTTRIFCTPAPATWGPWLAPSVWWPVRSDATTLRSATFEKRWLSGAAPGHCRSWPSPSSSWRRRI